MVRSILFFITTVGALVWVLYAGMNLVNFSEKSNPEKLFGAEDGRIFILNRPQEIKIEQSDFNLQPRLTELYSLLVNSLQKGDRIFVSELKAHILLQTNSLLSEEQIMSKFIGFGFVKIGAKKYQFKNFKISFYKGVVDCQIESEKNNINNIEWNSFDKKSSYSIIEFDKTVPIIKDYYQKNGSTIIYTRQPTFKKIFKSFDDQAIYSNFIPSMASSYQFTEKFTFAKRDPVFEKSPAFNWTNSGIVLFEFNDANFLLMDLLDGYDPKQMLEIYLDTTKNHKNNYTGLLLTENFPYNKAKGFYLHQFDNYALVSDKEFALNEAEIAIELGQTLGRFKAKQQLVYENSPKNVVERVWNSTTKKAISAYKGTLIGVEIKNTAKIIQSSTVESEVKSYALNNLVADFIVHESKDLLYAIDKDNILSGFQNGKNFMTLKINESITGEMQWSKKENPNLIFTTPSKLYVMDSDGHSLPGFPLAIEGGISRGVTVFNVKGIENYLIATFEGIYYWIDNKGQIVETGKTGYKNISQLPNAWFSARKLFFGFKSDTEFSMIRAEKGKVYRSFSIPKNGIAQTLDNQIQFYDLESNDLVQFDQKGNKTKLTSVGSPIWIKPLSENNSNGFCVKSGNVISYYSANGEFVMKSKIQFESVDFIAYNQSTLKGQILGVLDGLNNKVFVYKSNGRQMTIEKNQAQKKIAFSLQGNKLKLYTIIDKFIIQYVL